MSAATPNFPMLLDALGRPLDDSRAQAAIAMLGGSYTVTDSETDPDQILDFTVAGVELTARDGVLTAAFLYVRPEDRDAALTQMEPFAPDASGSTRTRGQFRQTWGTPRDCRGDFDLYEVDGRFIHLWFDEFDTLTLVTVTAELPPAPVNQGVTITGGIEPFILAQGYGPQDPPVVDLVARLGGHPQREDSPGELASWYLTFMDQGVDILVEDDLVRAAFIDVIPSEGQRPVPGVDSLMGGISAESSREQIREILGPPLTSGEAYDLYRVNGRVVHFEFRDVALSRITVMLRQIPDAQEVDYLQVEDSAGARVEVFGDVGSFLSLVGKPPTDQDLMLLAAYAGTEIENEVLTRDGVEWLYLRFTSTGVEVQIKDGVIVGILIPLIRDVGNVYGEQSTLILDLDLPATQEAVREYMGGAPAVSGPSEDDGSSYDLYHLVEDRSMSFGYVNGTTASITLLMRGVTT